MDHQCDTTIWFALLRAVHFGACLLLFGVWAFDRFIIVRADKPEHLAVARNWESIARLLVLFALPIIVLSGAGWLAVVTINMSGLPASQALKADVLRMVWSQTHFGALWELRWIFWLAAILATALAFLVRRPSFLRAALKWVALIASGCLAASLAWAGHGLTEPRVYWHLLADALHVLVGGVWPVGLLPFAWLLLRLRRAPGPESRLAIASITRRFSVTSLTSVALLAASGLVNSWLLVGTVSNLFHTSYGRVLVAKIILFCLMVGIGAINFTRLKPRLSLDGSESSAGQEQRAAARLQFNVMVEIALTALVLVLVGLLGILPPAME